LLAGIASAQVPETSPAQALVDAVPQKLVSEAVSATLSNAENGALNLYLGEVRILKFSSQVSKVAIGNGKVLSTATIAPTEILMIANDAGESTLYIWLKNGTEIKYAIAVGPSNPAQTSEQLIQFLKEDSNIKVTLIGDRIFVEGNDLTPEQENRLAFLLKAFPQVVPIFGGGASLQERTVFISAQILEITKRAFENLGVNWSFDGQFGISNTDLGAGVSAGYSRGGEWGDTRTKTKTTSFQTYLGLASNIAANINLLQEKGEAYVVASPHLTARCGGKAKFNSGGSLPIATPDGSGGFTVNMEDYGIILEIEPLCDKRGNIRAKIKAEVSEPDLSVAINGNPGIKRRTAESELDLLDGKAMLLSGLSSLKADESDNRIPFLGAIPVLGRLFRNPTTDGKRSELVILITPSFVTPESEVVQRSLQRRNAIGSDVEQVLTEQGIKPFKDSLRALEEAEILPFAQKPRATEDIDILPQESEAKPPPLKPHKDAISFSGEVSE
jgi:pilus assembly protein CpaC